MSQASPPVIAVRDLCKAYRIYRHPLDLLRELLFRKPRHQEYWALRGINFEVRRGEIVGLVGANGAGKSTLLRILSGVLDSSGGSVTVGGQLRAILELGTGFQEHYTGRENIFLGGACLGYSHQEIQASLDWIIEFSELRRVIDQPFRTYSSGMKSRLTFAVTFFKKPEVMIIDEALSVGDSAFNTKCTNRILELCEGGATALVVSHNLYVLERLCHRVLYLDGGTIVADGPTAEVCQRYERDQLTRFTEKNAHQAAEMLTPNEGAPAIPSLSSDQAESLFEDPDVQAPAVLQLKLVRLARVSTLDACGQARSVFEVGEPVRISIDLDSKIAKKGVDVGVQIFHESGIHVVTTTNRFQVDETGIVRNSPIDLRRGSQTVIVDFPHMFLGSGKYFINVGVSPNGEKHFSDLDLLLQEKRCATLSFCRRDTASLKQLYDPPSTWSVCRAGQADAA
jgi:lipopolysaccharide transport system ATP-binding protein